MIFPVGRGGRITGRAWWCACTLPAKVVVVMGPSLFGVCICFFACSSSYRGEAPEGGGLSGSQPGMRKQNRRRADVFESVETCIKPMQNNTSLYNTGPHN